MIDEKRKEVLELLLENRNPGKIIKENLPQYLYKYRSGSEWDLEALENDSIWMGSAMQMDDPLDSRLLLTDEFRAQIKDVVNKVERFKNEKYSVHLNDNSIQRDCFLCSLSEVSDSDDMWERYANNEQGFCIEYNAQELICQIRLLLLPVYYGEKLQYDAKTLSSLSKETLIFNNFLIKNKVGVNGEDWYSQREWRIIGFRESLGLSENEKGKCISIIKPTRIILGKYVRDSVKIRIMNWKERDENKNVTIEQR